MSDEPTTIDGWAIVSQFGHTKLAGRVSTVLLGGSALLRVDIPAVDEHPAYTRYIGVSSIFDLTLVTEELAVAAARSIRTEPVTVYLPPQLTAGERAARHRYDEAGEREYGSEDEEEFPL